MEEHVHIDGVAALRRALREAGPDTVKELRLGLAGAAKIIAGRARELAPYGTQPKRPGVPHLRDTIKAGAAGSVARVYSNAVYAKPIHWGWAARGIKPHPFIDDAVDEKQDEFVSGLELRLDALYSRLGLHPSA